MGLFNRKFRNPAPLVVDDGFDRFCAALAKEIDPPLNRDSYASPTTGEFRPVAADLLSSELALCTGTSASAVRSTPVGQLATTLHTFSQTARRDPRGQDKFNLDVITFLIPDVAAALHAYNDLVNVDTSSLDEASQSAHEQAFLSVQTIAGSLLEDLKSTIAIHDKLRDGYMEDIQDIDEQVGQLRSEDVSSAQLDEAFASVSQLEQSHPVYDITVTTPRTDTNTRGRHSR